MEVRVARSGANPPTPRREIRDQTFANTSMVYLLMDLVWSVAVKLMGDFPPIIGKY